MMHMGNKAGEGMYKKPTVKGSNHMLMVSSQHDHSSAMSSPKQIVKKKQKRNRSNFKRKDFRTINRIQSKQSNNRKESSPDRRLDPDGKLSIFLTFLHHR